MNARLATFCNRNDATTKIIVSLTHSMHISFETNGSILGKGFSGSYRKFDSEQNIALNGATEISTKNIQLNWTSNTPAIPVMYKITWLAKEFVSESGEMLASNIGVFVQGLTPGTEYNFTVLCTIQGNEYFKNITFPTHFTLETLPAPPGQLNESSSNLHNIPYVLRFEPSEGRVARYNIIVGGKSYEVFNPELTIKDLTADTQYSYTITAYNKHGVGSEEVMGNFKTGPVQPLDGFLKVILIAAVPASCGFVIMIGIIVSMALVIRKKRRNSKRPTSINSKAADAHDISLSNLSSPATRDTVKNKYMTMNVAHPRAKVSTDQNIWNTRDELDGRDYDYIGKAQRDSWPDASYENLRPTKNVGKQDGQEYDYTLPM